MNQYALIREVGPSYQDVCGESNVWPIGRSSILDASRCPNIERDATILAVRLQRFQMALSVGPKLLSLRTICIEAVD